MAAAVQDLVQFVVEQNPYNDGLPENVCFTTFGLAIFLLALGYAEADARRDLAYTRERWLKRLQRKSLCDRGSGHDPTSSGQSPSSMLADPADRRCLKNFNEAQAKARAFAMMQQMITDALNVRTGNSLEGMRGFEDYMRRVCPIVRVLDGHPEKLWNEIKFEAEMCKKISSLLRAKRELSREEQVRFARSEDFDRMVNVLKLPERVRSWVGSEGILVPASLQRWEDLAQECTPNIFKQVESLRVEFMRSVADLAAAVPLLHDLDFMCQLRSTG